MSSCSHEAQVADRAGDKQVWCVGTVGRASRCHQAEARSPKSITQILPQKTVLPTPPTSTHTPPVFTVRSCVATHTEHTVDLSRFLSVRADDPLEKMRPKHPWRLLLGGAVLVDITRAQNPCEQSGVSCKDVEQSQRAIAQHQWRSPPVTNHRKWKHPRKCPAETNFANIEDLWPEEHFRGPFSGPKVYWKRVPPHYLGKHANFTSCRRRVYIDVGARTFDSNEGMLGTFKIYPELADFDEFYAFEAVAGFYKLPPQPQLTALLRSHGMSQSRAETFARRHFFFQAFVGARSDPSTTPPMLGFSDFLRVVLGLQPADAVVVKMDVEGWEFDIVRTLLEDGTHALIDEIMLEVHYGHPKMRRLFNWCKTPQFWCSYTLQNATSMYQSLRDAGVYAHHWP